MLQIDILKLDLQLHGEGGGAAAGSAGAGVGGTAEGSGETSADAGRKAGKGADLSNVIYGNQQASNANPLAKEKTEANANQTQDRKTTFRQMVKGEWRAEADEYIQGIVKQRLRGSQEMAQKLQSQQEVIDALYSRYPSAHDVQGLKDAMAQDTAYLDDEALERGIPKEELIKIKDAERQLAFYQRQEAERQRQESAQQQMGKWFQQAEEAKQYYPSLDFQAELDNPAFTDLLKAGIPVQTAFEVVHKDEIIPAAMQYTAQQTEQKLAASIAANGRRPTENGMRSGSASIVKSDVSKLTKADRQEIARRAAAGERITFGNY